MRYGVNVKKRHITLIIILIISILIFLISIVNSKMHRPSGKNVPVTAEDEF